MVTIFFPFTLFIVNTGSWAYPHETKAVIKFNTISVYMRLVGDKIMCLMFVR